MTTRLQEVAQSLYISVFSQEIIACNPPSYQVIIFTLLQSTLYSEFRKNGNSSKAMMLQRVDAISGKKNDRCYCQRGGWWREMSI